MPRADRRWTLSLVWVNLAVVVMVLVLIASNRFSSGKELLHLLVYALVYANLTGIPAVLFLPALVTRLASHKLPLVPVVVVGITFFVLLGCLVAQALLTWTGVLVPQDFWRAYLSTLRSALLLSLVFGLGSFFYASIWDRLRHAEQKLQQQEVEEERTRKLAAEARLQSLESRIHPHFLFNTLNSISSLVAVNPNRAEQTVGRLAALLRSSLDNTSQPLIPLGQEVAMIEDYVEIEKVRFGDKLRGRLEVPENLRDAKVPPLSIQSLVENAVKHGITPQRGGGEFLVTASAEDESLRIEVEDSGPGFDLTAVRAGHGLDNLVGRLDALFGAQARLNVFRRDGRCVVQMVLPRS
jgi:two-component system sensor histidine kinase AlgZ